MKSLRIFLTHITVLLLALLPLSAQDARSLELGFADPPGAARLHAYWWWLNGNVTAAAITRDLEAMKEKGFGGALIMDAGGAEQDGNRQVPHGPDFGSAEWRVLYRHALREAARLDLELALNIQSGWNLGGPNVTPADAAKILDWTETVVTGPGPVKTQLPATEARNEWLGEVAVVAVPEPDANAVACEVTVSSAHPDFPVAKLCDANANTFWVSDGVGSGKDPLAWVRLAFDQDRVVNRIEMTGRPGYGPKAFEVLALGTDGSRRLLAEARPGPDGAWRTAWDAPQTLRQLEIRVTEGYDNAPVRGAPRNVQIAELLVQGSGWQWPASPPASIANWDQKTLRRPVGGANHDTSLLLASKPTQAQHPAPDPATIIDLSKFVDAKGSLAWTVPAGRWRVYRFCHTVGPGARVSTSSEGWRGLALDPLDSAAFQRYWDQVIEPLMQDAAQVAGRPLKYLHTDSWEIEPFNWTANLPVEFKRRCGYEMTPWLPVLAQRTVRGVEASERFLHDYRKTVAALIAENHYGTFLRNAHRHGLQVRAESGGPHGVPLDAQHCLGMIDVPMSEFWATSWRHRVADTARFFVKQPASAAHTYGKNLVAAEGFTTIGPHWQETVWDNLKPNFDRALCEGLNQLVWTLVTCSPTAMGRPGQEMFPGTHFNPNSTWWRQSEGFLSYINRCQWLLRQGHFVADVLYYYGDHAPNFAGLKASNPAQLPAGYDYDIATEQVVLHRLAVKDGRLVLPDGMSYAALVLAPQRTMSLPVLRKLRELAAAGGTIIGLRPDSSSGLLAWQQGDPDAVALIDELWGNESQPEPVKHTAAASWLTAAGLAPDFEAPATLNYIHRRDRATDIFFVANPTGKPVRADLVFRLTGKAPELWDPRSGTIRPLPEWRQTGDGRTSLPLELDAFGSAFLVFRKPISGSPPTGSSRNFPPLREVIAVPGPWQVAFDPAWFYPDPGGGGKVTFETLQDWTKHPMEAVRHFSGAAVYRTTFDAPEAVAVPGPGGFLSLGAVREMARVRLNGRDLGIAWCPPWRVPIPAGLLVTKANRLEIEVVNFWPNRLIGDTKLPPAQRRTRTNITKFENPRGDAHYTTLMPSGLLGPVRALVQESAE